jgi:N-acetylglucosamine-6-sulfatase
MVGFQSPGVHGIHGGTYNYFDTPYNVNGHVDNRYKGKYQTNVIGGFSRKLVRKYHQSSNPFFLYVSFVAPHHGGPREKGDPVHVRRPDGRYESLDTPARPSWVKGRFNGIITRSAGLPKNGGPSEADVSDKPSFLRHPDVNTAERAALRDVTRQRAEAVYVLDQQVGRLVSTLKKTGEWNNTVLMFTSDNGYFLGEHRKRQGKILAHEPSLRVPFLVTGPGMRTAQKRYDPISTVDITATIVDIANAAAPRTPDGSSLWETMQTGDQGWTTPVVTEAFHSMLARRTAPGFTDPRTSIGLRTPRYSFTIYQNGEGELYDLVTDPAEMNNQYNQPAYREIRNALTEQWWNYKNCAGSTCKTPLPADLQASAEQETRWTVGYWSAINDIYGW